MEDGRDSQNVLKNSDPVFKELFDHMSSAVAIYRAVDQGEDFVFVDCNKALLTIEKVSKDQIIGRKVSEVFPGIREFGLLEVFRKVYRTGVPEHFPVTYYADMRVSGWKENYIYKIPTGEIVATYDDLTVRKQAEEAALASRELMNGIINAGPAFVYVFDLEGKFILANDKTCDLLGTPPGGLIGKTRDDVMPRDAAEQHRKNDLVVVGLRKSFEFEEVLVLLGVQRHYLSIKFPLFDKAGALYAIGGISMDITERKRLEEEDRKHTHELEVFYKSCVGREERIVELKKEIESLKKKLKEPPQKPVRQ